MHDLPHRCRPDVFVDAGTVASSINVSPFKADFGGLGKDIKDKSTAKDSSIIGKRKISEPLPNKYEKDLDKRLKGPFTGNKTLVLIPLSNAIQNKGVVDERSVDGVRTPSKDDGMSKAVGCGPALIDHGSKR